MIQFASILARPFLGKSSSGEGAGSKLAAVNSLLAGGTGDAWLPLARVQATPTIKGHLRSTSVSMTRGEVVSGDETISWQQFDWPADQHLDDCTFNSMRWRIYKTGLICLELVASKDKGGFDRRDLLGHRLELRDRTGFVIGVWTAAFIIHEGSDHIAFAASAEEDFQPLKLHFDDIAETQEGICFRI